MRHDITELNGCPCLKYGYGNYEQAKKVVRQTSATRVYACPHRENYFHVTSMSKQTFKQTKLPVVNTPAIRCDHCNRKVRRGICDGIRRGRQIPWLITNYGDESLYNFCDGEVLNFAYQMNLIPYNIENDSMLIKVVE